MAIANTHPTPECLGGWSLDGAESEKLPQPWLHSLFASDPGLNAEASRLFSYCSPVPWVSFSLASFPEENDKVGLFPLVTK